MAARNACVASTCTPEYHPLLRTTYQNQGIGVFTMVFGTDYYALLRRSFVAMFGPMSLPTHYYIYETYYKIFAVGLLAALLPVGFDLHLTWLKRNRRTFLGLCMFLMCAITIFLCIYYSFTWDFQPQGRYLMPMLPSFMYLVTLGIRRVFYLVSELLDRLRCRSLAELLPGFLGRLLLSFIAAALLYTVFAVVVPHYL